MKFKKTAIIASVLSVMLLAGCTNEAEKAANQATEKAANATATAAKTVEKKAGEVADKIDMKKKVWTLEQIRTSEDFVVVAKDHVGTSYVYKPSIEVKTDDGKQKIEAIVWRDYVQDKHLIKEEQEYEYNLSTKDMQLAVDDVKVYTYDGKFVEDGKERKMQPVDKDAYGYIMGQNILKVKNGEKVEIK